MDAVGLRGFILTEDLAAKVLASWMVEPERWARFFQDLSESGGLTGDKCTSVEQFGDKIAQAAQKMTDTARKLDVGDTLDVEIMPAAGRGARHFTDDDWFITLTGKQARCAAHDDQSCPMRHWGRASRPAGGSAACSSRWPTLAARGAVSVAD